MTQKKSKKNSNDISLYENILKRGTEKLEYIFLNTCNCVNKRVIDHKLLCMYEIIHVKSQYDI